MTLEKAFEILTLYMKPSNDIEPVDFDNAVLLGIEALKFKKALADSPYGPRYEPLPGETKE